MTDPLIIRMRNLWRSVLSGLLLEWRKEWVKHPSQRDRVEQEVRTYLASRDGREVIGLCGWEFGPREIDRAVAAIAAPKGGSKLDIGNRRAA